LLVNLDCPLGYPDSTPKMPSFPLYFLDPSEFP
jgi:hypothetical protein